MSNGASGSEREPRVCAVVVTRDRRELLRGCLTAVRDQDRPPDGILVVDNASSDGTSALISAEFPEVELIQLSENLGGAGGFKRGMAQAYARGFDWMWLMDDDTIPRGDALRALLAGAARAPVATPLVVASQVRWKDERLHPMNAPVVRWRRRRQLAEGVTHRLLLLRWATFVSVAIHRSAIDRFGLPLEHYFIWGDDVEFTARALRDEPGYLVPESVAYHWTPSPHPAANPTADRFYYHARNSLLLLRGSSLASVERLDYARYLVRSIKEYVKVNRSDRRRLLLLARALRDGMTGATR